MELSVLLTCALIALARVTDITLDTLRTAAVVQGRRFFAAVLGFGEAAIFICVVAKVLQNFNHPVYAIAYASGFATGTFLGITLERRLAFGEQLASVFTRDGDLLAATLRQEGYRLTEICGRGRDGELTVLYIKLARRQTAQLIRRARQLDRECFYVVHDIRLASAAGMTAAVRQARRRLVA